MSTSFWLAPAVSFVIDEWQLKCEGQIADNGVSNLRKHLDRFRLENLLSLRLVENVSDLTSEETLSAMMPVTIPQEVEANLEFWGQ